MLDEAGPGINEAHSSRGVAFGDFDNDGDLDILIVNQNEPPSLLRNDMSGNNHWLKVLLIGTSVEPQRHRRASDRVLWRRRQAQAVMAQSSYLSVNDRRLHFGLGQATSAALEVVWPNGPPKRLPASRATT